MPSRLLVLSKLLTVSHECVRNVVKITRNTDNEGPSGALLGSSRFHVVFAAFHGFLWFCKNCGQARGENTVNCGPRGTISCLFTTFHDFQWFRKKSGQTRRKIREIEAPRGTFAAL